MSVALKVSGEPNQFASIIYGPYTHAMLGHIIEINPFGALKACSFDCPYCYLGPTQMKMNQIKREAPFPELSEIEANYRSALTEAMKQDEPLAGIFIAGNGEPTVHPGFAELVRMVIDVRNELAPTVPTGVMTNLAKLDQRKIKDALNEVDIRYVKLDAGREFVFKNVNAPIVRATLSQVVTHARQLNDCIVQSLFLSGVIDNTSDEDLEEWLELIGLIAPKEVHIYTISQPGHKPGLKKAEENRLHFISNLLKRRKGISSSVFP